jgi:maleamate amidohydrolase
VTQNPHGNVAFGNRLGWGERVAVLLVDVCRAYVDDASPLRAPVDAAVAACATLADAARRAGVPVVFTRVEYAPGGADGGVFFRKVPSLRSFERGNPLGDWAAGGPVPAAGDAVVTKQYASAFFGTSLAPMLRASGVDTVVIGGLSTSGCVRATGVDACQHGFVPIVVGDACGDRDAGAHQQALWDLDAKYADVVSLADVLTRLETSS